MLNFKGCFYYYQNQNRNPLLVATAFLNILLVLFSMAFHIVIRQILRQLSGPEP